MGECRNLRGSTTRSVVLGIRLAGATVLNRDEIAEKALNDEKVQKALHEAFRDQARAMTEASLSGKALDGPAAKAFMKPMQKAAVPAILNQVKKQKEYTEAARGLNELKCEFNATPVGVFVDENKTWLIISGVVLSAGGIVAMYHAKSGDVPAKGLAMVTNLAANKIEIGDVTFGVAGVEFKPSTQSFQGTASVAIGDLKVAKVKSKFELKAVVKAGNLQELVATDTVIVPLADNTGLNAKASVGVKENQPTYEMALTVKHNPASGLTLDVTAFMKGLGPAQTIGGKATAGYQLNTSRVLGPQSRTTLGATGSVQATRPGVMSQFQPEGALTIGLTATFN